jgi:GNAT superfamily N-acetyltransferase
MTSVTAVLADLEHYYDTVPRDSAFAEEIGPFTLFVRAGEQGWPFYARPRLGVSGPFTVDDVRQVRERQRTLGAPEAFEWVHETTPQLADAVAASGLRVSRHPLMVLRDGADRAIRHPGVRMLEPDSPEVGAVDAAVGAAFRDSDEPPAPSSAEHVRQRMVRRTFRLAGAFDADHRAVGGGSHSPRSTVTELTGIAVLPSARNRGLGAAITAALVHDARELGVDRVFLSAGTARVAAIYARVGFEPLATACVAEPGPDPGPQLPKT